MSTSSGRAEREAAVREVQDAVDLAQHRVDVVRDEQHGGAGLAAVPVDEPDDGLLVGEVEARERLVAQQQPRVVGERLADAQPLLLAAGEQPDGPIGEVAGADRVDEARRRAARSPRRGNGRPNRWPSTPSATRSRPRRAVSGGSGRCCGM